MKLPKSYYNWTSIVGTSIAVLTFFLIVFFFIVSVIFNQGSSYMGLIIYIILPSLMVFGMILIPVGMLIQIKRKNKQIFITEGKKWPKVDLNDQQHRNAFSIFVIVSFLFLFLTSVGSYEAFRYSESVQFCGTLCHDVMEPEYVTYQNSAHARVACVECHVGEGADWYVRSKISGLYQVYAVTTNVFPRPIPTPVENLRPARETCEKCHWPEKFYSKKARFHRKFLTDETNSEWDITQMMKIGPDHHTQKLSEGIHWHINPDVKIEYMTDDARKESIKWIKYTNIKTGKVNIYKDQMEEPDSAFYAKASLNTMDCMDCHNRPAHTYKSPSTYINEKLASGEISTNIPYLKMAVMDALSAEYLTKDSADMLIAESITNFYKDSYPEFLDTAKVKIDQAIDQVKKAYHENTFPEMKARWDKYPNHLGHKESNGCFRCHDNNHQTDDGRVIPKKCNLCHSITSQGRPDSLEFATAGKDLEFRHPVDIGTDWLDNNCADCHSAMY